MPGLCSRSDPKAAAGSGVLSALRQGGAGWFSSAHCETEQRNVKRGLVTQEASPRRATHPASRPVREDLLGETALPRTAPLGVEAARQQIRKINLKITPITCLVVFQTAPPRQQLGPLERPAAASPARPLPRATQPLGRRLPRGGTRPLEQGGVQGGPARAHSPAQLSLLP